MANRPDRPLRAVRAALGAVVSTMALAGGGCTAPSYDLALTGVHVVDVRGGAVLEDRTVLIREGRIQRILPREDASGRFRATRVVEGQGRFLIPGLWDSHVHFRTRRTEAPEPVDLDLVDANRALLPLYIAHGVTTVRDAGGDITEHVLAWRNAIEEGTLLGPRILTSGPKLDGPTGGWAGSIRLDSPEEVPAAIDSLQRLGADYVKIYDGSVAPEVYLAIVEEAVRRDLIVTGHMPLSVSFADAVEAGLSGTEHLYYAFTGTSRIADSITTEVREGGLGFWPALWALLEAPDPDREQATYAAMAQHGTVAVPTLHIGFVLGGVDEDDHRDDPELGFIAPEIEATYADRVRSARASSPETRRLTRELRTRFAEMVPRMHEAGVTLLAGSDAGAFNSFVYPGSSLHEELRELVAAGLSPLEALRAATIHPAEFMGLGHELGEVRERYRADLVLLAGNPLIDIGHARAIEVVVLGGDTVLERVDLRGFRAGVAR